jgi:hypothetical protein
LFAVGIGGIADALLWRLINVSSWSAFESRPAIDIVEVAAIAVAMGMRVDELARIPASYPT